MKLTNKHFYESHPEHYNVLSDYVNDYHREVPILGTEPETKIETVLSDCYIDENGNFFAPNFYNWAYKGSDEYTDPSEYAPVYDVSTPTLTKLQIEKLIALDDSPEFNDPARNI